jgi:uncharacterized protein
MFDLPGLIDHIWLVPLAGLSGGFLAGLIGVGGGILITPFLISIGIPARYVAGTMPMVVITNALSTLYHLRLREKLHLRLGGLLGLAGATGGVLGALLVKHLELTADIDRIIQFMFVVLLLLATLRLLSAPIQAGKGKLSPLTRIPLLQFNISLTGESVSLLPLLLSGLLIGGIAVMMGVGGAILLTPALIILLGVDIKQASALAVVYLLITGVANAISHALITQNCSLLLGLMLMPTGAIGVIFGVRLRHRLPLRKMNQLFALLLTGAAFSMGWKSWHHSRFTGSVISHETEILLSPPVIALFSVIFPVIISVLVLYIKKLLDRKSHEVK